MIAVPQKTGGGVSEGARRAIYHEPELTNTKPIDRNDNLERSKFKLDESQVKMLAHSHRYERSDISVLTRAAIDWETYAF